MSQQNQKAQSETPLPKSTAPAFDKDAIVEDMNSFWKAYSYSRREKQPYPVFVSDDVFDIVTDGDIHAPLFWKGEGTAVGKAVPIVPASKRAEGLAMLNSDKKIDAVIVR